jgi:hypothetical protein
LRPSILCSTNCFIRSSSAIGRLTGRNGVVQGGLSSHTGPGAAGRNLSELPRSAGNGSRTRLTTRWSTSSGGLPGRHSQRRAPKACVKSAFESFARELRCQTGEPGLPGAATDCGTAARRLTLPDRSLQVADFDCGIGLWPAGAQLDPVPCGLRSVVGNAAARNGECRLRRPGESGTCRLPPASPGRIRPADLVGHGTSSVISVASRSRLSVPCVWRAPDVHVEALVSDSTKSARQRDIRKGRQPEGADTTELWSSGNAGTPTPTVIFTCCSPSVRTPRVICFLSCCASSFLRKWL